MQIAFEATQAFMREYKSSMMLASSMSVASQPESMDKLTMIFGAFLFFAFACCLPARKDKKTQICNGLCKEKNMESICGDVNTCKATCKALAYLEKSNVENSTIVECNCKKQFCVKICKGRNSEVIAKYYRKKESNSYYCVKCDCANKKYDSIMITDPTLLEEMIKSDRCIRSCKSRRDKTDVTCRLRVRVKRSLVIQRRVVATTRIKIKDGRYGIALNIDV
ncbi:Uncharacterised protein g3081 [Pycnogonum litorale]